MKSTKGKQSKEVLKKQKRQGRKSVPSCGAGFFYGDFWGCTRDMAEKSVIYERPGRKIRASGWLSFQDTVA